MIEKDSLNPVDVGEFMIGGVLSGGAVPPSPNTPEAWVEMIGSFQKVALETRLGIPILYGSDAVGAVWLPGSEGAAVADVLYGRAPFAGHLPFTWPRNAAQLPIDPKIPSK